MDQSRDHETKPTFGLEEAARRLLRAVADGASESIDFAKELAKAVLGDPLVVRAIELDELLRRQSPLGLVRAVELADGLLAGSGAGRPALAHGHESGRGDALRPA